MTSLDPGPGPSTERDSNAKPRGDAPPSDRETCDVCGSVDVAWLRCKLICLHCRTILMTCGDL